MTTREDFEKWCLDAYGVNSDQLCLLDGNDMQKSWQACAAHYEAERNALLALIAEKDKALDKFAKGPMRPMPDPGAHSWEAFGKAWMEYATDCKFAAIHALSLTHDSVKLVEAFTLRVSEIAYGLDDLKSPLQPDMDGTKLYTIVE